MPRMGLGAFRRSNTDFFTGLPGENKDGEELYKGWIEVFNNTLTDGKHLNLDGNRKMMKIIKSKILSDLKKFCMRDLCYSLGASWLPSVMGLVKANDAMTPFMELK